MRTSNGGWKRVLVAGAWLTLSCGVTEVDDTGGVEREDIIGGTATFLRPEVGFVSTTVGGCSGTLISSKAVLTAGHCIANAPFYKSGGSVTIYDTGGVGHGFTIDRGFAQGRSAPGADDWSVLRLTTAVPASIAAPSTVSPTQPHNETLTAIGFGCTDRHTQVGEGVKRYLQYFYSGGIDSYLCFGDSGGPVFHGALTSGGQIVRVNSGFEDSGEDIGADAVTYRPHILAFAADLETQGVCYRGQLANVGWQQPFCNNQVSGTTGQSRRMEATQIWSARPGVVLCYQAYVQDLGWLSEVCDGQVGGTVGQDRRMEALKIRVASPPTGISVFYSAYVQDIGWQAEVSNGQLAGTTGQSRRMEALKVRLVP